MRYWLMKSEPDELSVDDLAKAPKRTTPWFGVRNYQARNFMRKDMVVGDGVLFAEEALREGAVGELDGADAQGARDGADEGAEGAAVEGPHLDLEGSAR